MMLEKHRFKVGDVVGVCSDCMAECEILKVLPKKKDQEHSDKMRDLIKWVEL